LNKETEIMLTTEFFEQNPKWWEINPDNIVEEQMKIIYGMEDWRVVYP